MLMSYEEFKDRVCNELMTFLPEEMRHLEMKSHKVYKVNETMDAIHLLDTNSPYQAAPTLYLNELYEDYRNTENFHHVMHHAADVFQQYQHDGAKRFPEADSLDLKDKIIFQLVNPERNQELLQQVPHRPYENLAIIYRAIINKEDGGICSTIIKNDLMESLKLNEEELYRLAKENTDRLLPTTIKGMGRVMGEMVGADMGEDAFPLEEEGMWVISNRELLYGSGAILNDGVLEFLSDRLESDLFLLPSSIHEWIVVKVGDHDLAQLRDVVQSANESMIEPNEFLSDSIYFYDSKEKELDVCQFEPEVVKETYNLAQQIQSAFRELKEEEHLGGPIQNEHELC